MGRKECSVKCEVWRKQWEARSVKCGVWSVKCGVWSVSLECEERSVKCEVWGLECEGSSEKWEVWSVKCEVWSVKFEVWSAKSAVCSVRCGVSREGHGRDRLSLNYRSFIFGKLPPPACPGLCYESFTCDQTQGHKFKLEILLASQNKLLPKFQKERKH